MKGQDAPLRPTGVDYAGAAPPKERVLPGLLGR